MIDSIAKPTLSSPSTSPDTPNSAIVGLVSCHWPRKVLTWPMNRPRRPTGSRRACHSLVCLLLAKNDIRSSGPSVCSVVSSRYAVRRVRRSR